MKQARKEGRKEGRERSIIEIITFGTHIIHILIFDIVDYIFFIKADVTLDVSPNEVRDVKWVTPDELRAMFADASKFFVFVFVFFGCGNFDRRRGENKQSTTMIRIRMVWR